MFIFQTPRKCFERAAEKCHADNLSNIVASCAWGKHVSVGTGSPFEILWDTRKVLVIAIFFQPVIMLNILINLYTLGFSG